MKKGIQKKGKKESAAMKDEVSNMEQRLEELKVFMKAEKEKRAALPRAKDGSRWRSGTDKMGNSNYVEKVMAHQPNPNRKKAAAPATKVSKAPKDFMSTEDIMGQPASNRKPVPKRPNFDPPGALEAIPMQRQPQYQSDPSNAVLAFLQSCSLEQYYDTLIENGIDEMDVVTELSDKHLEDLGIPLGHRIKLSKRIKDYAENPPAPVSHTAISYTPDSQHVEVNTDLTQETPDYAENYDAVESYNMYSDALSGFQSGPKEKRANPKSRPVEARIVQASEGKTVQWTQPSMTVTSEAGTVDTNMEITTGEKKSCWNCYKLFAIELAITSPDNKIFCSHYCASVHIDSISMKCPVCGNKFLKQDGIIHKAEYICSEACKQGEDPLRSPAPPVKSNQDDFPRIHIDPATGEIIETPEELEASLA